MTDKTPLEIQIEQEEKELKEAPVIQPIIGQVHRCHICGAVYSATDLRPFDTHVPNTPPRHACPNCHPERTT
jgi:hypothetical protein